MITVLIVEDSRVVSEYLYYILSKDPQIQVIGNVSNGKAAIDFIEKMKPDVITMDVDMPIMNGLEATKIIMSSNPIPIIIVTASRNANQIAFSIEALAAGALSVIGKPVGLSHPLAEEQGQKLVTLVKLMAEISVVKRKVKSAAKVIQAPEHPKFKQSVNRHSIPELVVIGVSSGGPQTLQVVLAEITDQFPVPIVIVQHIAQGFLPGLVTWLGKSLKIPVRIAGESERLLPGAIYFAPDGHFMGVTKRGHVKMEKNTEKNGLCPSVAYLFRSAAKEYGSKALGIILTGMGSDGAKELKLMRDAGAETIAQSKDSALIFGMPGVAVELGAAKYVLSAEEIGKFLVEIEKKR